MRVPTINELQDLWVYHRVEEYCRDHRPAPDHSLFIAEFRAAIDRVKADAWDEVADNLGEYAEVDDSLIHLADSLRDNNPYREQEEA